MMSMGFFLFVSLSFYREKGSDKKAPPSFEILTNIDPIGNNSTNTETIRDKVLPSSPKGETNDHKIVEGSKNPENINNRLGSRCRITPNLAFSIPTGF